MKLQTISAAAAAVLLLTSGGVFAQTAEPAPAPTASVANPPASSGVFEILRADDRNLSCEALSGEFNSLTAGINQQRADAAAARQRLAAEQQERWFCTEAEARQAGWRAPRG